MKIRKGDTIIEILVSVFIFSCIIAVTLVLYTDIIKTNNSNKNTVFFESVCLDIDKYYDHYGIDWDKHYFEDNEINYTELPTNIYYDAFLNICNEEDAYYVLSYGYSKNVKTGRNQLIVNVKLTNGGYVVKNLQYGDSKYCVMLENFYINVKNKIDNGQIYFTSKYTNNIKVVGGYIKIETPIINSEETEFILLTDNINYLYLEDKNVIQFVDKFVVREGEIIDPEKQIVKGEWEIKPIE